MKKILIILVILIAGILVLSSSKKDSNVIVEPIKQGQEAIDLINKVAEEKNVELDSFIQDDVLLESPEVESTKPGTIVAYDDLSTAQLEGDIVLAFMADWCPSCRAFKKDTYASLDDIPTGLTIVDVNYDRERDLKKTYAVTTQHTFVQIDNQGNEIKKWRGGNTLEDVVSQLN